MGAKQTETVKAHNSPAPIILVTGGGGFLGGAIAGRLVKQNRSIRSFSRRFYPKLEALGVEQVQGDIADQEAVASACEGIDLVFHTAAKPPPWGRYADYYQTNVMGTQNVIDACLRHNVSRLIYTSAPSVIFNGADLEGVDESMPYPARYDAFYPQTKAMAEQRILSVNDYSLRTIILRPHQIWGPGDSHFVPGLIARAKNLRQIGNGKNLVDTTYIDNAVEAHLLAAEKLKKNPGLSGNIYFISQGEPISAWYMINAILEAAGLEAVTGTVSYRAAWTMAAVLEFFHRILRIQKEPYITRFLVYAAAKSHWFDISASKRDLGYAPAVSIKEGIEQLKQWLQKPQHQEDAHAPDGDITTRQMG